MRKIFFALLLTFSYWSTVPIDATQLEPWHGTQYSIDIYGSVLLQQFQKINTKFGDIEHFEFDAFYNLSALGVLKENLTAEIEVSALDTRHRLFGFSALRLTGRYFLSNDIIGDPISIATGITLSKIFDAARRNLATFDHGGIACEGHIAIGKEISCERFWTSRAWSVLGVGIADVGWPWLKANLIWEHNWWEFHQLKIFADSIWGFGKHDLRIHPSFQGYGSVQYQAIDIGLRYGYRLDNDTFLSIEYAYRAFGRNCPSYVNLLKLEVCYPFTL